MKTSPSGPDNHKPAEFDGLPANDDHKPAEFDGLPANDEEIEANCLENMMSDDLEFPESSECSSSFGFTDSGDEIADVSGEMDVESKLRYDDGDPMLLGFHSDPMLLGLGFDGCSDFPKSRNRLKKLTPLWSNYIRPLTWRCKWAELHIRELQSLLSKYDRELLECEKRKCELEQVATEDNGTKSTHYVCNNSPEKLMKRKKRRRVEDTVDLVSYKTRHSLFSYFGNNKSGAVGVNVAADHNDNGNNTCKNDEFDVDCEMLPFEYKDRDAFESILYRIEEVQAHVRHLKEKMDKVVKKNAEMFASEYSSFPQHDQLATPGLTKVSPYLSSMKSILPETAVSMAEEVTPSHIIKTVEDSKIVGKCEKIENEIIMMKKEVVTTEYTHPAESLSEEPEVKVLKIKMPQGEPTIKTRSSSKITWPKNKKKRGRPKRPTTRWSKRISE